MQPLAASSAPESPKTDGSFHAYGLSTVPSGETLTWRVHLLRESPSRLAGIAAAALLAAVAALVLLHSAVSALVTASLVLISVAEFLLPLHYTLDDLGAHVAFGRLEWVAISWPSVRSAYRIPGGIKLSPFERPRTARLEQCRGVRLRVPSERLEQVEAAIRSYRAQSGGAS